VLGNLGVAYAGLGDAERAIDFYDQSLTMAIEIGDQRGQARAILNKGQVYAHLGKHAQAIDHAETALKIFEEVEDPNAIKARELLTLWRQSS